MAETKKMLVTFYEISPTQIGDDEYNDVVDKIMYLISGSSGKFAEQNVSIRDWSGFNFRVFHIEKISRPRWRYFMNDIVDKDSVMRECLNVTQSFILFVGYKGRIFAITGGLGSIAISPYVSSTFGIDVITRLIDKTSQVIKFLEDRGLTGSLLGQTKYFRRDRRISDESQFGQIYKKVRADLDKQILTSVFGFKKAELKRDVSGCLASTSFKINKNLDINGFLKVITNLNTLLDKPPKFSINSVEHLIRKRDSKLIARLENERLKYLYDKYKCEEDPDFDFTHHEFDRYLQASIYKVTFADSSFAELNHPPTLLEIQKMLRKKDPFLIKDEVDFKHFLLYRDIQSEDSEGNVLTHGTVLSHLHGEIYFEGRSYFFIEGEWYKISSNFIDQLDRDLKQQLDQYWDETLIVEPFDLKKDEGVYNASFIGHAGTLVFDTVTAKNIELCDVLKYDPNSICLVHIKKGFNNMMRDLTGQVSLAARTLHEDRKSGFYYINELERKIKSGKNSTSELKESLPNRAFPQKDYQSYLKKSGIDKSTSA